jgi:trimethylamine:corrinoid methyltransferase-like protein
MADSSDYSTWEESGKTRIEDRAKEEVKEILNNYKPKPLDNSIQSDLDLFQEEVDQRAEHKF